MPQQGETRTANGETRQWSGTRWEPVSESQHAAAPMYQAGLADTPESAFMGELGRTGKEAAIGLARSPLDLVKGLFNTVVHPVDTIANTAHAVVHPLDTIKALGDDPRAAGSLLGQLLLAPKLPGLAEEAPGTVGRGMGAVGRGLEAAGTKVLDRPELPLAAAGTAFSGHPIAAAAEVGLPLAAKYGGRGLQAAGRSLEGLNMAAAPAVAETPDSVLSGVQLSPEAVQRNIDATNLRDVEGYSHEMAGKLAGIPGAGKAVVTRVPIGDYAITDEMIKNAGGTVTPPPEPIDYDSIGDPRDPPVASSMQGLERAVSPNVDPTLALRDDAVRRYLDAMPDSAFARLRSDRP